jgi:hypothetical protein
MDSTNKDLSHSLNKPNNNRLTLCQDRICLECGNDHSFRGNFEDAITSIDTRQRYFQHFLLQIYYSNSSNLLFLPQDTWYCIPEDTGNADSEKVSQK